MPYFFYKLEDQYSSDRNKQYEQSNSPLKGLHAECWMIVNHTGTGSDPRDDIFALPCYPESISESQDANWVTQSPLGRSSPLSTFTGTGYRAFGLSLKLHREMTNDEKYIDRILVEMRKAVYPKYTSTGMLPPITTFQFGEFRCKGYITNVGFNWQKPIVDGYYQLCDVSLSFVDVPDKVFAANNLNSVPTNPFKRDPIRP